MFVSKSTSCFPDISIASTLKTEQIQNVKQQRKKNAYYVKLNMGVKLTT